MTTAAELWRQGRREKIWRTYCGFLDLKLPEFMDIQNRLLLEQLELLRDCELGRHLLRGASPTTVEEFREQVPLTTYKDYAPFLLEKREDVLPASPIFWQRTSGRSGEYPCKWVPLTQAFYDQLKGAILGLTILASCEERGSTRLEPNDTALYGLAPPPYVSGSMIRAVDDAFPLRFLPPIRQAEKMNFQERLQQGFLLALEDGLDFYYGLSSVLVAMGERFSQRSSTTRLSSLVGRPRTVGRFFLALLKSKLARRPILPRDIWKVKGLACGGTDSAIYRDQVKYLWGRYPLDVYASAESGLFATQAWDYQGMTFFPQLNFLEFLPEEDCRRLREDPDHHPHVLMLDEVEPGQCYETVMTSFHGGAFVRYRIGDLIRIVARRNDALDIDIPQMRYESRADGVIDLAGFTRLTEVSIWRALEESGIGYAEWSARKEIHRGQPVLHLYLELKEGEMRGPEEITPILQERLKAADSDYLDIETMLGRRPLQVTLLATGTFARYMAHQQAAGADPAHTKPPHMNPSDRVVELLLDKTSG